MKRLLRTLGKTYGECDLFSLLLPYADKAAEATGGVIRHPAFYRALERALGVFPQTEPTALAQAMRPPQGGYSYRELALFYDYAVIAALLRLSERPFSEKELCDTVEYLKALHDTTPNELYPLLSEAEGILRESPYFADCEEATENACRRKVSVYAKKHRITEGTAARILIAEDPFAYRPTLASRLYFPVLVTLSAALALFALLTLRHPLLTLFLLLPLSEAAKVLTDFFFSHLVEPRLIPRKKLASLPDDAKTLTVITALIGGNEEDLSLVERLRNCYFANRDPNAHFGLLCDLREAQTASTAEDAAAIGRVKDAIEALNERYGCRLFLFVRSRRYAPTEGCYMGWERKRGAILELTRLLNGRESTVCVYGADPALLTDIRYVITLDTDTRLYHGAVSDMVGAMLHPSNTPRIEGGVVTAGHAILQPRMEASLTSAERTPFAVLSAESGGTDIYATASYETYETLFDEGIFCGKGIFDRNAFSSLIDGRFPDGTVLSHDLLEGSRLRAGALTDVVLTDDLPRHPLACFDRSHRWIRGDVQALLFSGRYVLDSEGRHYRNPISALSRHKLRDNLRRALTPVSAVAALFLSLLAPSYLAAATIIFALSYLILPFALSLLSLRHGLGRRFVSYVLSGTRSALANLLYSVASLLQTAQIAGDAVLRAGYRVLFSRRRMLEWKTASDAERGMAGLSLYLYRMLPSLLVGTVLLLFCPRPFFRVLGALWAVFPLIAYRIGRPFSTKGRMSEAKERQIRTYAADIWSFFAHYVTEADHHLPPDNYQLSPVEAVAHRTSPTNIGLYLLSCLAAHRLGLLTLSEMVSRLKKTLHTVTQLPTWQGHLYNWYDTQTLSILGAPYVSTVDSGNFITCLVALREGLRECSDGTQRFEELSKTLSSLIDAADFSCLYDAKKRLLLIGKNTADPDGRGGCYDLFMSEARTTSYYAIAAGQVPREHWGQLGRVLLCADGYPGLASWTGTMFEYLMPTLLLPTRFGSLSYEAVAFALREQRRTLSEGVWGRSESGYYRFDASMNYQYRAFGVPTLGLKRGLERDRVIAPYATMLTLRFCPGAALENLKRLRGLGMYGPYGFFEAIDFTPARVGRGRAIIRSYMSHHMGMSLLACANACLDNCLVRAFMADPRMASGEELLEEKIPVNAVITRQRLPHPSRTAEMPSRLPHPTAVESKPDRRLPYVTLISENGLLAVASGELLRLSASGVDLSLDPFVFGRIHRPRLLFAADGCPYDAFAGVMSRGVGASEITWRLDTRKVSAEASLSILGASRSFVLTLAVEGRFARLCPLLLLEPTLTASSEREAHPAYADLMVCAEYHKDEGAILYKKEPKDSTGRGYYLAVSAESHGGRTEFETRRDRLGLLYTEKDIEGLLRAPFEGKDGALIHPFLALRRESVTKGKYLCNYLLSFGRDPAEVLTSLRAARRELREHHVRHGAHYAASLRRRTVEEKLAGCQALPFHRSLCELMLTALYRPTKRPIPREMYPVDTFWRYGISGDLPLFCLTLGGSPSEGSPARRWLRTFFAAHKYLALSGIRTDLVVLYESGGEYRNPRLHAITEEAEAIGGRFLLGHSGGIFPIDACAEKELFRCVAALDVTLDHAFTLDALAKELLTPQHPHPAPIRRPQKALTPAVSEADLRVKGGRFDAKGFTVVKGDADAPDLPWSYVYAGRQFGTLVTQNSLGYTWIGNCHERRITPFDGDPLLDFQGEQVILTVKDLEYELAACASLVSFTKGGAIWRGQIGAIGYVLTATVDPLLPCKVVSVRFSGSTDDCRLSYRVTPVLGEKRHRNRPIATVEEGDCLRFLPRVVPTEGYDIGFLVRRELGGLSCGFLLGAHPRGGEATLAYLQGKYRIAADFEAAFDAYEKATAALLPTLLPAFPDRALSRMTAYYLPYQVLVCRFFGRTGFYQSGGAYGFRDQLQDCLALLLSAPDLVRAHLVRSACHQYEEGDVMHWWHTIRGVSRGVRSRYTDDRLFLPYAVAEYITATGDRAILDLRLPYLSSPPLNDSEHDRYERPARSRFREPLYYHCVRAIEVSLRFGVHRLPLMGGGDWNDGMNLVGENGGESVWLGLFLVKVLKAFLPIALAYGDVASANRYRTLAAEVLTACEACYRDGHYVRAFYGDGTPLGDGEAIDLLPQAFAVLAGADPQRAEKALLRAYTRLYDPENAILRLLDPPYTRPASHDPGYLAAYPPGVRENGGQYTHAAVWGAMALIACGRREEGITVLRRINPAALGTDPDDAARYRGEPYFLAGDVSGHPAFPGRCGWSLYTGAAGWYYRAVTESILGLSLLGDAFSLRPCLCEALPSFRLHLTLQGTLYRIEAVRGEEERYCLDGKIVNNLFYFDKKEHFLKITVEKFRDLG